MEFKNFTGLALLILFFVIPLIIKRLSNRRIAVNYRYLIPAIIFTGAIFSIWDIRFTSLGIKNFSPDFFAGTEILKLPLEKWLSFIIIPWSSIYVYEYLKVKLVNFEKANLFLAVSLVLLVLFMAVAYLSRQKLFTFFTFFLLSIYLGYTIFRNRFKRYYTKFYLSYFITLLPFMLYYGILFRLPAISIDPVQINTIRFFNVPLEFTGYLFLMLMMTTSIYEYLKERRHFLSTDL